MAQGILPFRYEGEPTASGMTALAGLPPYLELAVVFGLIDSIRHRLKVCAEQKQGWTDSQIVMPLVLLNVAGGNFVDDLRILEGDESFAKLLRRMERRELDRCWRKERKRAVVPSQPVVIRYLGAYDNPAEEAKRVADCAFIPAPNEHL